MNSLKTASFFRPSSRSSSPASPLSSNPSHLDAGPDSRPSTLSPLNRLAVTPSKRQSLPPTFPAASTLMQDGSYLEILSLKLNEAASRALALPAGPPSSGEPLYNGKRLLPNGRGSAFAGLIVSELNASASNPHLYKAILRLLHRPLSVLLTNVSTQLLPLISSPQFTVNSSSSTPAQCHAVAYATFAAEIVEVFDARGLGQPENDGIGVSTDSLQRFREGFESLIARVINPLIQGIKNEITPFLETLEQPPSVAKQSVSNHKGAFHPSVLALQGLVPLYARNITRYVTPTTSTSQTTLATFLISLIWQSLVSISHRPRAIPSSNPAQSNVSLQAVTSGLLKRYPGSNSSTPPGTPRFSIRLPSSRPPSPPSAQPVSAAGDARALYDLLRTLPRPVENSRSALAREAVDEAFSSLATLCTLLDAESTGEYGDLDKITADLPTVIVLPVLLRMFAARDKGFDRPLNVVTLLQSTENEYHQVCLSGFGKAEACGPLVAKRVLDALVQQGNVTWEAFVRWLEARANLLD